MAKKLISLLLACLTLSSCSAAGEKLSLVKSDDIIGLYENPNKTRTVRVYKNKNLYYGVIETAPEKPDGSEGVGYVVFKDFKFDADNGVWNEGKLKSPMYLRGTYSGILSLNENKDLVVKGFLGVPILGGSSLFPRIS